MEVDGRNSEFEAANIQQSLRILFIQNSKKNLYFCKLIFCVMLDRENKIIDWFRRFTWKQRLIMYAAVVMLAVVYVFVFSDSNYHIHQKLNTKIKEQEAELKKAEKNVEIQSVNKDFKNDSVTRERYRREQLNMKKPNEDVFYIK